jgi:DNA repair exonuclease SbcCD nuclease subunit
VDGLRTDGIAPVKIVHLSDTHLGFRQLHRVNDAGRNEREQDVYDAFERAISKIIELAPAAVIHAGDLFDSYHPSSAALGVALDGLGRLRDAGIPVVVIAGNHSSPRVAAAEHIFGVLERFGGAHMIYGGPREVRIGDLAVHAIPHDNDPQRLSAALRRARPSTDAELNVLVAHVGLDGLGQVVGSEAGSVTLSGEVLTETGDFDYIALGHLHKFAPACGNAAYAGSLERLSWADDAPVKGIIEVDLGAGRRSPDYLRIHPIEGRRFITLDPVDAAAVANLSDAIVARAEGVDLAGAMVRLSVRNVSVADWNAVDHKAIVGAYAACLHFEREPQLIGAATTTAAAAPGLRDFLLGWAGEHAPGLDTDNFVARAEAFIALADQELAA